MSIDKVQITHQRLSVVFLSFVEQLTRQTFDGFQCMIAHTFHLYVN